ncbi:MAG: winged helix-turn-helix transcriptional regulator [Thermoplasmatota archaeon]
MTEDDHVYCPSCRARLAPRIAAGIAEKKRLGLYRGGRPPLPKETEKRILAAAGANPGASLREMARLVGVSPASVRRVLLRHGFRLRRKNVPEADVSETIN